MWHLSTQLQHSHQQLIHVIINNICFHPNHSRRCHSKSHSSRNIHYYKWKITRSFLQSRTLFSRSRWVSSQCICKSLMLLFRFLPSRLVSSLSLYSQDWHYKYFCRIDEISTFPQISGIRLTIDDSRLNQTNASCFHDQSKWRYAGVSSSSLQSSLIILADSLRSNRTYQFMVEMQNKRNSSLKVTADVLVHIKDNPHRSSSLGKIFSSSTNRMSALLIVFQLCDIASVHCQRRISQDQFNNTSFTFLILSWTLSIHTQHHLDDLSRTKQCIIQYYTLVTHSSDASLSRPLVLW